MSTRRSQIFGDLWAKPFVYSDPEKMLLELKDRIDQAFKRLEGFMTKYSDDDGVPLLQLVDGRVLVSATALADQYIALAQEEALLGLPYVELPLHDALKARLYFLNGNDSDDYTVSIVKGVSSAVAVNTETKLITLTIRTDNGTTPDALRALLMAHATLPYLVVLVCSGCADDDEFRTALAATAPTAGTPGSLSLTAYVGGIQLPVYDIEGDKISLLVPAYAAEAGNPVKEWVDLLEEASTYGTLIIRLSQMGILREYACLYVTALSQTSGDELASVVSFWDPDVDPLPTPVVEGARYIASATGKGWTKNHIYTGMEAGTWEDYTPDDGDHLMNEDDDREYFFISPNWVDASTIITHNACIGLQGGTSEEYYHLTQLEHDGLTGGGSVTYHKHDADGIVYDPTTSGLAAADVQGAVDEVEDRVDDLEALTVQAAPTGVTVDRGDHPHAFTTTSDTGGDVDTGVGSSHGHVFTGSDLPVAYALLDDSGVLPQGGALYAIGSVGMLGSFNADNTGGVLNHIDLRVFDDAVGTLAAGSTLVSDNAGAPFGYAVYFDPTQPEGTQFECNNARDGLDIYVPLTNGLLLRVRHNEVPGVGAVAVYFNDGDVSEKVRLNGNFGVDVTGTTATDRCQYGFVPAGTNAAEATHKHTAGTHTHGVTGNTDTDGAGACVVTDAEHAHGLA